MSTSVLFKKYAFSSSLCLFSALAIATSELLESGRAGVLYTRLDFYRQVDSSSCDRGVFGSSDRCDPYFAVAAGLAGRRQLARFESQPVDNAHPTLQFGSDIGKLPNPLAFAFDETDGLGQAGERGLLHVEVTVKDHDPYTHDDLMEQFRWSLSLANLTAGVLGRLASPPPVAASTKLVGSRRGDQLALEAWIACRPGFLGPGCGVPCRPRPGFGCELATGRLILLSGVDPCAGGSGEGDDPGPRCANGGECLPVGVDGRWQCRCRPGFAGPRCQTVLRPCLLEAEGLEDAGGRRCLHGVCVRAGSDGNASECACRTGYQGELCDQDVNECRLAAPCQHGAVCENLPGGFACRCPPGFSGRLCQLPPMLLPPPAAAAASASASDGSQTAVGSPAASMLLTATLSSVIAVLLLLLVLLSLIMLRRRRKSRGAPKPAAVFAWHRRSRRRSQTPPGVFATVGGEYSDEQSCYESIDDSLRPLGGENGKNKEEEGEEDFEAGENFPNAAYVIDSPLPPAAQPPQPPPRPWRAQPPQPDALEAEESHSNCYV